MLLNLISHMVAIFSLDWLAETCRAAVSRWFPVGPVDDGFDSGLAEYHLTNLGCTAYFAVVGTATWFLHPVQTYAAAWTRFPWIQNLLIWPMFHYQVWNFFQSFRHRSLRDFPTLFHHAATLVLSAVSASVPVFQYPALYMCGPFEISSVFLVIYNLFCLQPAWKTRFARIHQANKFAFSLSFLGFRILGFAYYLGRHFFALIWDHPALAGLFAPLYILQLVWAYHIASLTIHSLWGH